MARKLGLGLGVIGSAALLLAGCQTGTDSRLTGNTNLNSPRNPAIAKQSTPPQPNFPVGNIPSNSGFGTATGGALPQSPGMPNGFQTSNSGFATQNNQAPIGATNNPPQGPQGSGTPTAGNRSHVTITQPSMPLTPPTTQFAEPGISPITPPAPPPGLPIPPLPN